MTRDQTAALIVHDCEPALALRLELGARARTLGDAEVVEIYGRKLSELATALVATPQLRWDEASRLWTPRGAAIRCVVERSLDEPIVLVDEVQLSVGELTTMLANHGAQICLVFLDD